jgi:GTPase SAR1 family protein
MLTNKFVEDCEPTSTFNAEELKYKKFSLAIWDLGGKTPHLWVHHYIGTQGIVFVIDSNDMHKYDDVKKVKFHSIKI